MKKKSYFEEFDIEQGSDQVSDYLYIKDEETGQVIGSVYYSPVPNGEGTAIFYLGYGDKLHPYENTEQIEELLWNECTDRSASLLPKLAGICSRGNESGCSTGQLFQSRIRRP